MAKSKLFTMASLLLLFLGGTLQAKEWRGIVPLTSSREDVIRIFKQCADENPSCEFRFKNEDVHIEFSGVATSQLHKCSRQLPADTVLLVEIIPQEILRLKNLGINKKSLRAFKVNSMAGGEYRGYIDDKEGMVIKTYEGKIVQVDYIAALKDRHLCQGYYENPESFVQEIFLSHTPAIALNCPTKKPQAGERINFSADILGTPKISFLWTVSAGKVIAGQGTRNIMVDTTGLQGQMIKATVALGRVAASCEVQISTQ